MFRLDEEGRRSVQRRGLIGHYLAGGYRTLARPIATAQIVARVRLVEFLWGMDGAANLVEKIPERYLNAALRTLGATVAPTAVVGDGLRLATVNPNRLHALTIGHKVFFGRRCIIDMSHEVTFGDFCTLGNDTSFVSHTDFANSPLKQQLAPMGRGPVRIGRGAFIGSNTMIGFGVTIGECAIIGANSYVDRSVPPYTFAAGTPARVLRELDRSKIPPFDPDDVFIIPPGSTPEDFPYPPES